MQSDSSGDKKKPKRKRRWFRFRRSPEDDEVRGPPLPAALSGALSSTAPANASGSLIPPVVSNSSISLSTSSLSSQTDTKHSAVVSPAPSPAPPPFSVTPPPSAAQQLQRALQQSFRRLHLAHVSGSTTPPPPGTGSTTLGVMLQPTDEQLLLTFRSMPLNDPIAWNWSWRLMVAQWYADSSLSLTHTIAGRYQCVDIV